MGEGPECIAAHEGRWHAVSDAAVFLRQRYPGGPAQQAASDAPKGGRVSRPLRARSRVYSGLKRPAPAPDLLAGLGGALASGALGALALAVPLALWQAGAGAPAAAIALLVGVFAVIASAP